MIHPNTDGKISKWNLQHTGYIFFLLEFVDHLNYQISFFDDVEDGGNDDDDDDDDDDDVGGNDDDDDDNDDDDDDVGGNDDDDDDNDDDDDVGGNDVDNDDGDDYILRIIYCLASYQSNAINSKIIDSDLPKIYLFFSSNNFFNIFPIPFNARDAIR